MQTSVLKAKIVVEALSPSEVTSGTIALVMIKKELYSVTVSHGDRDSDWVVTGDYEGTVDRDRGLLKLHAVSREAVHPIAVKSWPRIIKNNLILSDEVIFEIIPKKFTEGHYTHECNECHGHFDGSYSSHYCKGCCIKLSTAHLPKIGAKVSSSTLSPKTISYVVSLFDNLTIGKIKGSHSDAEVRKLITQKLKDGPNITENTKNRD